MLKSGEVNWDAVRAMYVTTTMSLRDVANRHGLKLHTVETRSRKGGWVAARMAWRARAAAEAMDRSIDGEADRLAKIIHAANSMAEQIDGVFDDPEQFRRHVVVDTVANDDGSRSTLTVEKQFAAVNTKAMRDLAAAIKDMTQVLRNLHNLPTQAEQESQRIAAERLELDKRKAAAAEAAQQVDKSIVVKLEGGLEGYAR